ncbi:uroporphyrinogen decarboxylase [Alteribacillus persepolensis]|uniref:Uroporphyrinogen decarboxylase n=1 Tax=Alteribacillus persepolensis TaxID=568899 RepID=A0A1G8DG11_9BACI|nr:uroporphyrinogen decarboxylase [Alteribacillus persepolensis]SDH56379.1 uroporphyrinogen decarboxylase [Alteribacillus persepolensis]
MGVQPFNDNFLRAALGKPTDHIPVWYMRQAGRSQPEYRKLKEKYSLFEITHDPELCAYVTKLPVDQYQNDAAILYKDIMTPLPSIGVKVDIKPGIGPVIDNPIQTPADVEKLGTIDPEKEVPYVLDTIKILREQLNVPLISFSGAPFTLASYMIEGGPSKNYHKTKAFMHASPKAWFALMDKLGDMTIQYVASQIKAGAQAIQIFDSWVGTLSAEDYRYFVKPVMKRIFDAFQDEEVPFIMFGVGAGHLLKDWNDLSVQIIGLDWRTTIQQARQLGVSKVLQGNLDPSILLAPWHVIEEKVKPILEAGMQEDGFVFNLGHGVFPEVDPDTLKRLTAFVHDYTNKIK